MQEAYKYLWHLYAPKCDGHICELHQVGERDVVPRSLRSRGREGYDLEMCAFTKKEDTLVTIRRVGVVGCGLMGGGIAQTCAQAGYETIVHEVNQQLLDNG